MLDSISGNAAARLCARRHWKPRDLRGGARGEKKAVARNIICFDARI